MKAYLFNAENGLYQGEIFVGAAPSKLIAQATEDRQLGFLGEPRVNVLVLNLELDKLRQ